jgi:hypothetical protein
MRQGKGWPWLAAERERERCSADVVTGPFAEQRSHRGGRAVRQSRSEGEVLKCVRQHSRLMMPRS